MPGAREDEEVESEEDELLQDLPMVQHQSSGAKGSGFVRSSTGLHGAAVREIYVDEEPSVVTRVLEEEAPDSAVVDEDQEQELAETETSSSKENEHPRIDAVAKHASLDPSIEGNRDDAPRGTSSSSSSTDDRTSSGPAPQDEQHRKPASGAVKRAISFAEPEEIEDDEVGMEEVVDCVLRDAIFHGISEVVTSSAQSSRGTAFGNVDSDSDTNKGQLYSLCGVFEPARDRGDQEYFVEVEKLTVQSDAEDDTCIGASAGVDWCSADVVNLLLFNAYDSASVSSAGQKHLVDGGHPAENDREYSDGNKGSHDLVSAADFEMSPALPTLLFSDEEDGAVADLDGVEIAIKSNVEDVARKEEHGTEGDQDATGGMERANASTSSRSVRNKIEDPL
eukprot:GSA120T00005362001.1